MLHMYFLNMKKKLSSVLISPSVLNKELLCVFVHTYAHIYNHTYISRIIYLNLQHCNQHNLHLPKIWYGIHETFVKLNILNSILNTQGK